MKIIDTIMDIASRTEKWSKKASAYMYNFKDGHFQFPYAANDPRLMIEALKKTPFVTFDEKFQCLESNSPFMKVKQNFVQIENGFWLISTHLHWKVKVKVIALIDNNPSDYFFLTYSRTTDAIQVVLKDGSLEYSSNNQSWTLYKSSTALDAYFKKNSRVFSTFFVFNKKWIEAKILEDSSLNAKLIHEMLNLGSAYKTYLYNTDLVNEKCNLIHSFLDNIEARKINTEELKQITSKTVVDFFKKSCLDLLESDGLEKIKLIDRNRVEKIEKLLCQTLTTGFLGLETLSEELDVSPTKLKNDFKIVFGMTAFQYYQKKQMELAVEMIKLKYPKKEIAKTLNYENQSKFAAKFKDIYGVLPSKYF